MKHTKIFVALIIGMIVLPIAQASLALLLHLEIRSDAGVLRYWVNDQELTRNLMTNKLNQVAGLFGSNQPVLLLCNTNVSATELMQTIADIQESGLHRISVMSQGIKHGTSGIYQISVDCSKWPYEDQFGVLHSGFNATTGNTSKTVRYYFELLSSMTNGSQQSVAPLPRAPQTGHSEGER